MKSYVKQENGHGWTGSGTMETTVHCVTVDHRRHLQGFWGVIHEQQWLQRRTNTQTTHRTHTHTYNWQAQQLFLPCCQSRASGGPVPGRGGGRAGGRSCHSTLNLEKESPQCSSSSWGAGGQYGQKIHRENTSCSNAWGKNLLWALPWSSFVVFPGRNGPHTVTDLFIQQGLSHSEWWAQHKDFLFLFKFHYSLTFYGLQKDLHCWPLTDGWHHTQIDTYTQLLS